jgi:hypothetical protein
LAGFAKNINGCSVVCDQKTSIFFISHWEQSMAGHIGINEVFLKIREGKCKGEYVGTQVEAENNYKVPEDKIFIISSVTFTPLFVSYK